MHSSDKSFPSESLKNQPCLFEKFNVFCSSLDYDVLFWCSLSDTHKKKMYCERQLKRLNMKLLHEWQQPALTKLKHGDGKETGADVTQRKTCRMKLRRFPSQSSTDGQWVALVWWIMQMTDCSLKLKNHPKSLQRAVKQAHTPNMKRSRKWGLKVLRQQQ